MTPAPDVKRALDLVATVERTTPDVSADLMRAQAATTARSRRRLRRGLAGLAAVTAVGIGVGSVLTDPTDTSDPSDRNSATAPGSPDAAAGVQLVAATFDATPYTFDLTPAGWSVQAQNPTAVTIVPDDGSASSSPDDFQGKLVIMFDANGPDGRATELDGRRFWVSGDSSYTTMATRTHGDEPAGVVRIQYPHDAGWDEASMLAFLASVHVGDTARHGHG